MSKRGLVLLAFLLLGACGAWHLRARWRALSWLLLPVAYFTLLHLVFVGSVRYRVPVMPLVEILAAWGVVCLWRRSAAGVAVGAEERCGD